MGLQLVVARLDPEFRTQSHDRELRQRCISFQKNIHFYFEKNDLAFYNAGIVVVNLQVVGFAPDDGGV
jgi:hypothetical protein